MLDNVMRSSTDCECQVIVYEIKCRRNLLLEWWVAGVVICLEQGADLRMAQSMPLPLTVSCFSKIQIGFTFQVPAHPGSPGQRAVRRMLANLLLSFSVLR